MAYSRRRETYLCMLVMILAVLVIAAPVMACEWPLMAADGEVVGCVAVTNDNTNLYVNFSSSPSYQMKMANWTWLGTGITLDSNGVPVKANFIDNYSFKDGEPYYQFPAVNIAKSVGSDVAYINIWAHAVVEKKDVQACTVIASAADGSETFTAYNNTVLRSDVSGVPSYPQAPLRTGKAVLAYISPWHNPSLYNATTKKPFAFTQGKWIWESYWVKDPWKGDVVDFTKTFTLNGVPESGKLWITADDGYNVSLNGVPVGSEGLNNGWRMSTLKYAYVPGHGLWKSVELYDLMKALKQGTNTFFIQTANRYMGCDNYLPPGVKASDSDFPTDDSSPVTISGSSLVTCGGSCAEPKGTTQTNIGALIFEAKICSAASSAKDAWVLSSTGAKYFAYPLKRVSIILLPFPADLVLPEQTNQTMTVKVRVGSSVVPDAPIVFETDFGFFPGGEKVASAKTDSYGVATITISSSTPGTANLKAGIDSNGNGKLGPSEWTTSTFVRWLVPTTISLEPYPEATVQLPLTDQDLTATVLDQYDNLMYTVPVTFITTGGSIAGANPASPNDDGQAIVTVSSSTPGKAEVTAFVDTNLDNILDYGELNATSTVTWLRQKAASISLEPSPEATVTLPQEEQILTATVLDGSTAPIADVPVDFTITFDSGRTPITTTVNSNDSGLAAITVTSSTADIATITATADGNTATSTVTWIEAQTSPAPSP